MQRWIRTISLDGENVLFEFAQQGDSRPGGLLMNRTLQVPPTEDYEVEIEVLMQAAQNLLASAMSDMDAPYPDPAIDETAELEAINE